MRDPGQVYYYMGFVPLKRRPYLVLTLTLLFTSLLLLLLTVLFRGMYGELSPGLKASQWMLSIGAAVQAIELLTMWLKR